MITSLTVLFMLRHYLLYLLTVLASMSVTRTNVSLAVSDNVANELQILEHLASAFKVPAFKMARKRLWFFLSLALLLHLVYQLFTQQGPVDAVSCEGQECSPYSPADTKGNANATGVYANGLATTHVALEALSSYDPEPRHDFTNKLTENNYIDKNTIKLSEKSAKKIVFYTKFFGDDTWVKMLGNGTDLREHQCPVSNCVFSYNISEAPEADAVLFHATDYNPFNVPKTRHSHQRYVWVTVESPGVQGGEDRDAHNLPFFNWTATYHRGSEIFVPYGYLVPLEGEAAIVKNIRYKENMREKPIKISEKT